jgi:hypothetical protein
MATAEMEKTELQTVPFTVPSVAFDLSMEQIEELRAEYLALVITDVTDKEQIAAVHEAKMLCKKLRVGTEKIGKAARDGFNKAAKDVIAQERLLTTPISEIEAHLEAELAKVKAEEERKKREAEEKRQDMIRGRLQALQECGKSYLADDVTDLSDADFAELLNAEQADKKRRDDEAAAAEAERKRVEAEQKAEADRLAKEREELERQKAEADARLKRMQARITLLANLGHEHTMTGDQLADMTPDHWEDVLSTARLKKQQRDNAAAEEQAKLDRQREEQEEREEQIKAEKQRVFIERCDELRKYAVPSDRTKPGQIVVNYETTAEQFAETLATARLLHQEWQADVAEQARREEQERQEREAAEAKARAEADERERQRIESLKPDHEKLLAVADAVDAITWADLSPEALDAGQKVAELLESCAVRIREVANKLVNAAEIA